MKIAYCGYDFFSTCLAELLSAGLNVYRVFTFECDNRFDYNEYVYALCQHHKLSITRKPIDAAKIKQLTAEGCELLITAGYRYKIPDLSASKIKSFNIHPTLLPTGRGRWPLPQIILSEQKDSGVTFHKHTQEFDAGDILLQQSFPLTNLENLETLSAKTQILAKKCILDVVNNLDQYWQNARVQSGDVSFWDLPTQTQRTLDWGKSIDELERLCRAFGKQGCYASFDNKHWLVFRLNGWVEAHNYRVGTVVHKTNTEMIIAAADGLVSLSYFQPL